MSYFGAAPDQYSASGVYAFTKADIGSEKRIAAQQQMLFDQNNATNGSAAPTTIVEDTLSLIPIAGAAKLASWGIGKVGGKLSLGKVDDALSHAADDALSKTKNDKLLGSAEQGVVNSGKADAPAGTMHGGDGVPKNADKWSRAPKSIQDQMTLRAAKEGQGDVIIKNLNDPNFKGMEKMELKVKSANGNDSVVHYVRDPKTGELMDFKFKKHSTEGMKPWGNDPAVPPAGG